MKVILTGGGTMGSVSPLLAIYEELKARDQSWQALWIGTEEGPERAVVEALGIEFRAIKSGRLRRFFSLRNLIDPFKILIGIHQTKRIIKEFQPDLVLTAGSFVCYPVARAAHRKKIPVFIHQQDIVKGLSNKMMEKYASVNTITFDVSLGDFEMNKTYYTSNPARLSRLKCERSKAVGLFKLDPKKLTLLVMGGGTGAQAINQLTLEALGEITKYAQVIHLTGQGKSVEEMIADYYPRDIQMQIKDNYRPFEYLEEGMCEALNYADLVVSRAGISSLTELSLLKKPTIIIPIPDSHQEKNAEYFAKYNAIIYLNQRELDGKKFADSVITALRDDTLRQGLSRNISQLIAPTAARDYVELIYKYLAI